MEVKVFSALKSGTNALKELNSQMQIDEIDSLMDDSKEALEYQRVEFFSLLLPPPSSVPFKVSYVDSNLLYQDA